MFKNSKAGDDSRSPASKDYQPRKEETQKVTSSSSQEITVESNMLQDTQDKADKASFNSAASTPRRKERQSCEVIEHL